MAVELFGHGDRGAGELGEASGDDDLLRLSRVALSREELVVVDDVIAQDALIIDQVVGPIYGKLTSDLELMQIPDI